MPRSVTHVITGLGTGGAETMLVNLLAATDRTRWSPAVVSLHDRGTLGDEIERLGVPVNTVGLGLGWPNPVAWWRVSREVRRQSPELVLGWMYHGNLAALAARALLGRRLPILWGIQYTPDDLGLEKARTALMIRLGARLSSWATRIVYNSHVSARRHAQLGYATSRATVIPNGFDTDSFVPSTAAREAWRTRLGVNRDAVVIGRIGRYHVMKDYPGFIAAASQLFRERPNVHFVLAGRGVDSSNAELVGHITSAGLGNLVSLLGEVRPVSELTAALDVACSSSAYGEGFPGVLAEAMACGVPCVSTDVGDSAWIVGSTGGVVAPRDPEALASALRALVDAGPEQRGRLGAQARARIRDNFSIQHVTGMYESLFAEVTA